MPTEAKVGAFQDEDRANRTVRWLRRSGLHPRIEQVGEAFEVVVSAGREEREARRLLQALERTRERTELAKPTGWDWVHLHLLNLETVGTVVAIVAGAGLLLAVMVWFWVVAGMIGWLAVIIVGMAALVYFQFSGHSAVESPKPWSRHSLGELVPYRVAWAREQYRRSRRWPFRRRQPKD